MQISFAIAGLPVIVRYLYVQDISNCPFHGSASQIACTP